MHYPDIDPIILAIGPVAVRWYGLAYLAAFLVCWRLGNWQRTHRFPDWTAQQVSDLVFYGALGAVIGGRLGYALFYGFDALLRDPLFVVRIWDGGMSFHGGLLGVVAALALFARRTGRGLWQVTDFVAPLTPIGLGFGRLGNFINAELPGRPTDAPWGLIHSCQADAIRVINPLCTSAWEPFARHPSPLYQAFAEGVVLFAVVWWTASRRPRTGVISGVFLAGYGALRLVTERFREPDGHLGFMLMDAVTMGDLLSLPMAVIGVTIIFWAHSRANRPSANQANQG